MTHLQKYLQFFYEVLKKKGGGIIKLLQARTLHSSIAKDGQERFKLTD